MKKLGFGEQWSGKSFTLSTVGLTATVLFALVMVFTLPISAFSAEKLVVKNSGGTTTFAVEDNGRVSTADRYDTSSATPGFWLNETGSGYSGAYFVLDDDWMQVQRRAQGFGAYEASPVFINVGAPHTAFVVAATGNVGFGKFGPSFPLHMASGAYVSSGGVWTNASSREYKTDIKQLTAEKAIDSLTRLNPVEFVYKTDKEERHVGFISEDAPELVATKDRKGMSSMDVVAVLTKVVQEQQRTIAALSNRLATLEEKN
jgi:hypothetical protein